MQSMAQVLSTISGSCSPTKKHPRACTHLGSSKQLWMSVMGPDTIGMTQMCSMLHK
jgi:hypothetical protein